VEKILTFHLVNINILECCKERYFICLSFCCIVVWFSNSGIY